MCSDSIRFLAAELMDAFDRSPTFLSAARLFAAELRLSLPASNLNLRRSEPGSVLEIGGFLEKDL